MKHCKKLAKAALILCLSLSFLATEAKEEVSLQVTEIMYDPEGTDSGHTDWIEVYNPTGDKISINKSDFGLIDKEKIELGKDGVHYLDCHGVKDDIELEAHAFLVIADDPEEFKADYPASGAEIVDGSFSLSSDGDTLRLSDDECAKFFLEFSYDDEWGGDGNGQTLERVGDGYESRNWQESYVSGGTPGAANSMKPAAKIYASGIRVSEVFPDPSDDESEAEFVELENTSDEPIGLDGWQLKDASKSSKYVFSSKAEIGAQARLVIYRKDFKFALNNSGTETVLLLDPNGKEVSRVEYSDSYENVSYALDGKKWRWTKLKTPGVPNQFSALPKTSVKKEKNVYQGVAAPFEVKIKGADKKDIKVTWDFGDGHKSYKAKTEHIYKKKKTYRATVEIFNGSETVRHELKVKVKDYPKSKVEIIKVMPNPAGSDADFEYVIVENKSKKKVDLQGWSIATGDKKLTNHPIAKKLVIKPQEVLKITREFSKFTLHNKQSKIELRYPTGKTASKLSYDRGKKSATEEEAYTKMSDGWQWVGIPPQAATDTLELSETPAVPDEAVLIPTSDGSQEETGSGPTSLVGIGENDMQEILRHNFSDFMSVNYFSEPLAAKIEIENGIYNFTKKDTRTVRHYGSVFLSESSQALNARINRWLGRSSAD